MIRSCRLEECPAVLALWKEAEVIPSATDTREELERLVREQADLLLVAEENGAIVGTIIAGWDGWRGNIYRLAVLPRRRRRGIARALLEAAERVLLSKGARRISALVERHDARAVGFWDAMRKVAYERDPRMVRYVKTL